MWKILLSIAVILSIGNAIVTVLQAQDSLKVIAGAIVLEEDYAWMCFPPSSEGILCVKVHHSKFCATEIVSPGVLSCIMPMMAEDEKELG